MLFLHNSWRQSRLLEVLCVASILCPINHLHVSAFSPSFHAGYLGPSPKNFVLKERFVLLSLRPIRNRRPTVLFSSVETNPIDQLSGECIAALMVADDLGKSLGVTSLRNELLLVGVVSQPERAQETLQKYGFNRENVRVAVEKMIRSSNANAASSTNTIQTQLPFSAETKRLFDQAMSIADHLGSRSVRSEHVVLALMGYNYGKLIDSAPVFPVLKDIKGLGKEFRCFKFCQDLVQSLSEKPNEDATVVGRVQPSRVVVGGNQQVTGATLAQVGVDLTQRALEGQLDRVYGRNNEINSALRTLGRRRKNNPCLVGEAGVGKTAIAEGIAQVLATALIEEALAKGIEMPKIKNPFRSEDKENDKDILVDDPLPKCPKNLAGARLISIDLASLVAGTANRGDFEKRVQNLIREASASNVILFIDELHQIVSTGGDGAMNAANLFKPALSRGEMKVLGATTIPEYRRYIEKDGALERRFQPIQVKEPTVDEAIQILASVVSKYELFHGVKYTNDALISAARMSDRYVSGRFLPDKAIDIIDEAGSMAAMRDTDDAEVVVDEHLIAEILSELTGIPIGKLDTGERERLRLMEKTLKDRIKGQDLAVGSVVKALRRARTGMRDGRRPVSTFLFCGPTGVGKTEVCKALAETYFGEEKDMIRIDMSEYMDRFSTSRLLGSPPGYVGYEEGGQLTEAIRKKPFSVLLFDEIEKAHEDVLNILLQLMDEGRLTDGKGRQVNFSNAIVVLTSNIGSQQIVEMGKQSGLDSVSLAKLVQTELEKEMKPELINRLDETIVFSPLSFEDLKSIASNLVRMTQERASLDNKMSLTVADNLVEAISREGLVTASQYGARPVRRAVQKYLEDTLSEAIIEGFLQEGDEVKVELGKPQGEEAQVKVTKNFSNGSRLGESLMISVPSSAELSLEYSAYTDIPKLPDEGDDESMPREPGTSFQ